MMKQRTRSIVILSLLALVIVAMVIPRCTSDGPPGKDPEENVPKVPRIPGPAFNPDSAYAYIQKQVDFGPRVPGTPEHDACGAWMKSKMESFGYTVEVQTSPVTLYTGKTVTMMNYFAQYKPERTDRVLLVAHWDTRHIADRDDSRVTEPIDGANDGGSGVGVLLEIARVLNEKDPNIGVDFLFVDAEDHGQPGAEGGSELSWCLGSQYWANTLSTAKPGYASTVRYGILLDMVGAQGATFPREGTSVRHAANVVEKVWSAAKDLGYGAYFVNNVIGETIDDNRFIIQGAGIKCIDIVHYDAAEGDYGPFHHRHTDNMDIIDPVTLDVVGSVVIDVLYNENPPVK